MLLLIIIHENRCRFTWASLLIRQGQLEDALPKLQEAYEEGRKAIPYHMTMSCIHYQRGLLESGMGNYQEAMSDSPFSSDCATHMEWTFVADKILTL